MFEIQAMMRHISQYQYFPVLVNYGLARQALTTNLCSEHKSIIDYAQTFDDSLSNNTIKTLGETNND